MKTRKVPMKPKNAYKKWRNRAKISKVLRETLAEKAFMAGWRYARADLMRKMGVMKKNRRPDVQVQIGDWADSPIFRWHTHGASVTINREVRLCPDCGKNLVPTMWAVSTPGEAWYCEVCKKSWDKVYLDELNDTRTPEEKFIQAMGDDHDCEARAMDILYGGKDAQTI